VNNSSLIRACFHGCVTILALLGSSVSVHAATVTVMDDRLQQTVSYADLNLNAPAGVATLYRRITSAARAVCRPLDGRDLASSQRHRDCVAESTAQAVQHIANPALTAYYNAKLGHVTSRVASVD
jgi:UrcA family protein